MKWERAQEGGGKIKNVTPSPCPALSLVNEDGLDFRCSLVEHNLPNNSSSPVSPLTASEPGCHLLIYTIGRTAVDWKSHVHLRDCWSLSREAEICVFMSSILTYNVATNLGFLQHDVEQMKHHSGVDSALFTCCLQSHQAGSLPREREGADGWKW